MTKESLDVIRNFSGICSFCGVGSCTRLRRERESLLKTLQAC